MAYRRAGIRTFCFKGRTRTGYMQVNTGVRDKGLAGRLEQMWKDLADQWAWDVLETPLKTLYPKWEESRHHLPTLRQLLAPPPVDHDVQAQVTPYITVFASSHQATRVSVVKRHLEWLLSEPRPASAITEGWLEERLAAYPGKQNTRRVVHSSWSGFFQWCAKRGVFAVNPMRFFDPPPAQVPPPKFYELPDVITIVEAQPTAERRALMALMYGTGADLSPALEVCRKDVDERKREVRVMGRKAAGRDRVASIQPWAMKYLKPHLRTCLPNARLFSADRWTASDWHRFVVDDLIEQKVLAVRYPLRNCRHHLAVLLVRSGWPLQAVADQLGNSVLMVTRHYARFEPKAEERAVWQERTDALISRAYTPRRS